MDKERLVFKTYATYETILHDNYIQRFIDDRAHYEDSIDIWNLILEFPRVGLAITQNYRQTQDQKIASVLEMVAKPKLTVILGGVKGGGKTGLCYWLGEEIHKRYGKDVCLFRPLDYRPDLLPNYFYVAWDENEIKHNSFVIYDEAQIFMSSRRSMRQEHVDFSTFLSIQRHRGVSGIISQQVIAMTDVNVWRLADHIVVKPLGRIQWESESRRRKRDPLYMYIKLMQPLNRKETLFMDVAELNKIVFFENPLPSFWCDELSTPGKKIDTTKEAINYAKAMYNHVQNLKFIRENLRIKGVEWTDQEVQYFLGISKSSKRKSHK